MAFHATACARPRVRSLGHRFLLVAVLAPPQRRCQRQAPLELIHVANFPELPVWSPHRSTAARTPPLTPRQQADCPVPSAIKQLGQHTAVLQLLSNALKWPDVQAIVFPKARIAATSPTSPLRASTSLSPIKPQAEALAAPHTPLEPRKLLPSFFPSPAPPTPCHRRRPRQDPRRCRRHVQLLPEPLSHLCQVP